MGYANLRRSKVGLKGLCLGSDSYMNANLIMSLKLKLSFKLEMTDFEQQAKTGFESSFILF